jgi:NADH:ubiquinone oxidoreductase subunit E
MTLEFLDVRQAREEREVISAFAGRDQLLPVLHAVRDRIGWISPDARGLIGKTLGVPPADVEEFARAHPLFSLEERPGRQLRVCTDVGCREAGSDTVCDVLTEHVGAAGKTRAGVTWLPGPCLGACDRAPAALAFQPGDPATTELLAPVTGASAVLSTRRPLTTDVAGSIVDSRRTDGGYLVCDADESGPGSFRTRVLLEADPFAVVEAMTVTASAIGARQSYLYLRAEYTRALRLLREAVATLGADIEVRRGTGTPTRGDESAIFAAIEGVPPGRAPGGLFGEPTVVTDVQTLLTRGAATR